MIEISDRWSVGPSSRKALSNEMYASVILDQVVCGYRKFALGD